ncbi:DNA primase [candidate division NPL-UPA2 bacterium]|nr:DNA primase [candidate division NPL-UPA2 bacterium]
MGRVPEAIIEEIQSRSDIVEIISEYLPLKPAGKNFKAPCPFHQEKTPSFMVSPERQIFNCFGCGVGGNVFSFLMKHEHLIFREALKLLADKSGIRLPADGGGREEGKNLSLFELNGLAADFFEECLEKQAGEKALKYLRGRGLSREIIRKFRLGYAPPSWDSLIKEMGRKGFSPKLLEEVGLALGRRDKSGFYNRFRDRIIFPIFNVTGKIVGFGGRVLDDSSPKYMNSPETSLYHKSDNLYGLNLTKEHILREGKVIVVEGYLDAITPYQKGMRNVVASLGTALSRGHLRRLRRYAREVIIVYDSDKAGMAATLRGLDLLVEEEFRVRVVSLPPNQDPDGFIREYGKEEFQGRVGKAPGLFDYKLNLLLSRYDPDSAEGKFQIENGILPTINKVQNAVEKRAYVKELATRLNLRGRNTLGEEEILADLKKFKKGTKTLSPSPSREEGATLAERYLIQSLLQEGELVREAKQSLGAKGFQDERYQQIAETLFELESAGKPTQPGEVINYIQDEELGATVARLAIEKSPYSSGAQALTECLKRIRGEEKKRNLKELEKKIKEAQSREEERLISNLQLQYQVLLREGR